MSSATPVRPPVFNNIPFPTQKPGTEALLSKGRNGHIVTSGVRVYSGHPDFVELSPLNSRGHNSEACILTLSRDPGALRDLASLLNRIADQSGTTSATPSSVTFHDRGAGRETRALVDSRIQLRKDTGSEMLYPELCAQVESQILEGKTSGTTNDPCYPDWALS